MDIYKVRKLKNKIKVMTKTQIKKEKTNRIINYLINEFNIHSVERENQYLNFRYKDDIMGSLDTRGFDILLCKDDYSSCADEANVMRNKVNKFIKSLDI